MKIGICVNAAFYAAGYPQTISGHVQIPLMVARILLEEGREVALITTQPRGTDSLPKGTPEGLSVHVVEHASRIWPERGVHVRRVLKQAWQLLLFLRKEAFDVVHAFGGGKAGLLLSALGYLGIDSRVLFTPFKRPQGSLLSLGRRAMKASFAGIHGIVATADYVSDGWRSCCGQSKVATVYPGVFSQTLAGSWKGVANSVLFWRNANYDNGADLAMESFRELAPKYPHLRFVFAVRPGDVLEADLLRLQQLVPNIDVHIYPYERDTSLATLLGRSLFVVQPFRSLSMNPQMSILETLYAGVPVVATRIESNEELIKDGQNGLLIPPDDKDALTSGIEILLQDQAMLGRLKQTALSVTKERWNWGAFKRGLLRVYDDRHDGKGVRSL